MHGRPRDYKHKLRDPSAQEAYEKKVDAIRKGTAFVLECRKQRRYDSVVMDAAAKLLRVVPEIYTIWNFRREALAPAFDAGGDIAKEASDGELALSAACLTENPKSYSSWHHRKWIVSKGLCSLEKELVLVSRALEQDERNFHAWNYRQFIVKLLGRSPEEELAYSEEKVAENFSNYSAWHYRSVLLPLIHGTNSEPQDKTSAAPLPGMGPSPRPEDGGAPPATPSLTPPPPRAAAPSSSYLGGLSGSAAQRAPIPARALDEEYNMVHQAFATDTEDQSPWMYYRWLVGNSLAHLEAARGTSEEENAEEMLRALLEREVRLLQEDHLAALPDAKWPLLTLARLKEAQARPLGQTAAAPPVANALEEARSTYGRLMDLDPQRRGYYQDALEGRAFVVVKALGTA